MGAASLRACSPAIPLICMGAGHIASEAQGLGGGGARDAGPKRDFTLSLGFALQRANSRMLRNADKRRRLARSSGKYSSGTRPTSSDEDY